jgi:hypothetical protein
MEVTGYPLNRSAPEVVWTFWRGESVVPANNQAQDCPICNLLTVLIELPQHPTWELYKTCRLQGNKKRCDRLSRKAPRVHAILSFLIRPSKCNATYILPSPRCYRQLQHGCSCLQPLEHVFDTPLFFILSGYTHINVHVLYSYTFCGSKIQSDSRN